MMRRDFRPSMERLAKGDDSHVWTAGDFRVTLRGAPFRLAVEQRVDGAWRAVDRGSRDGRPCARPAGQSLRHFQVRPAGDRHFGLGDKTGPLDRTGRRFTAFCNWMRWAMTRKLAIRCTSMCPIWRLSMRALLGRIVFYDSLAPQTFDLGCERSNYHGIYRYVEIEEAGLDLWLIAGPDLARVTQRFHHADRQPGDAARAGAMVSPSPRCIMLMMRRRRRLSRISPTGAARKKSHQRHSFSGPAIRAGASAATCLPGIATSFPIRPRCSPS